MEDKLKALQPKTKMRELKAIQKGERNFQKTLDRGKDSKGEEDDREHKKIQQLEQLFQKKEKDELRKQKLREKREQRDKLKGLLEQGEISDQKEILKLLSSLQGGNQSTQTQGPKKKRGRRRKSSILASKQKKKLAKQNKEDSEASESASFQTSENDKDSVVQNLNFESNQKIIDLENKLRKDEEELKEILKSKNWYQTYLLKKQEDNEKSSQVLKELLRDSEKEEVKEEETSERDQLYECTLKTQGEMQDGQAHPNGANYYNYFLGSLSKIVNENSESKVNYCMTSTKDQLKQHLNSVKNQLGETEEALAEGKKLEDIKADLHTLYGISSK